MESTNVHMHYMLNDSAKESDDSRKQATFTNPLLIARQEWHNQKYVPIKQNFK